MTLDQWIEKNNCEGLSKDIYTHLVECVGPMSSSDLIDAHRMIMISIRAHWPEDTEDDPLLINDWDDFGEDL